MSNRENFLELSNNVLYGLSPYYQESMLRHLQAHGSPNHWFGLNQVRAAAPAPFTTAMSAARNPYASPERHKEYLQEQIDQGMLVKENGGYCLTDEGRAVIEGFFGKAHEALEVVAPIDEGEMEELGELLNRVVAATLSASEPTEKLILLDSRWTDPGPDAPAAARVDQYVTDMLRYRDDAHLAAWRPYGVGGGSWEALTFVWREEAGTAAELAERLSNRGYDEAAYGGFLNELANRGWVAESDGRYAVTEAGKEVRQAAEDETDRLFTIGLPALGPSREARLYELLDKLNAALPRAGRKQIYDSAMSMVGAIPPVTRPVVGPAFQEHFGENGGPFFFPMLMMQGLAKHNDEPFSAGHFIRRFPYGNIERTQKTLEDAAEAGFVEAKGDGFVLSEKGQAVLTTVNGIFYTKLTELETLPDEDLERMVEILSKIVEASVKADEPADKLPTKMMHYTHPPADRYGALARIDQLLDDLNAFRDDAHRAAWQPVHEGLDGRSWETFTFVWRGQANSAAELAEKLPFRGFDEEAYAQSLADLVDRGWLTKTDDGYAVTEAGLAVREAAEEATDRYFFAPWDSLEANEQGQLHYQLLRLKLRLEELAPDEE